MIIDERVSDIQRNIYNWLRELYPSFKIILEKPIPISNQRIDIYIEQLHTAIEVDGEQHFRPVSFFVKSAEQWKDMVLKDKKKDSLLEEHGIRLIRIPYNHKMKSKEDLEVLINSAPYPSQEYNENIFYDKNKEYKKKLYKEYKERRQTFNEQRINKQH